LALTVGVLGALRADAPVTLVGQLFLAAGVGGALGSMATMNTTSARRKAVGSAGGHVVFILLGFAHYAPYDMPMWYSPRVVLLVAAALLLAATLVLTRPTNVFVTRERPIARRVVIIAAACSITAILVATVSPSVDGDAERTPPDGTLRVAVINIRMGFDLAGRLGVDQLADELAALAPDLVVLNEVDRGWLTTGSRDTLRIVQRALGHDAIFAPAADDVWGNALLTRYPWEEVDRSRLPQGRDAMPRGQFSVLLTTELGSVAVIGTHLSHVDDRGDTRVPQARAVAATVARYAGRGIPTIVAGDFNAPPGSVELNAFGDFVVNTFDTGHPTWPSDDPEVQIDHVLVSPSFAVQSASHFGGEFSDHIGLVVDLTLDASAQSPR
ncbi:MAG: endonuclease/exonuclease/phosphatase family protein, partial [Nitriliruptoraceae bacterium]